MNETEFEFGDIYWTFLEAVTWMVFRDYGPIRSLKWNTGHGDEGHHFFKFVFKRGAYETARKAEDQLWEALNDGRVGLYAKKFPFTEHSVIQPIELVGKDYCICSRHGMYICDDPDSPKSVNFVDPIVRTADVLKLYPPAPKGPAVTRVNDEKRCEKFIRGLVERYPEPSADLTKQCLAKKCRPKFRIGSRAFDRAWQNATQGTAWQRKGRRKRHA